MGSVDLSSLQSVSGGLTIANMSALSTMDVSALQSTGGGVAITSTGLSAVALPNLATVGSGALTLQGNGNAGSLNVGSLQSASGAVSITGNSFGAIAFPSFSSCGGAFMVSKNNQAGSLTGGPGLQVSGACSVTSNNGLATIDMGVVSVGGSLEVSDNKKLHALSMAQLDSVGGSASVVDNGEDCGCSDLQLGAGVVGVQGGASFGGAVDVMSNEQFSELRLGVGTSGGGVNISVNLNMAQGASLTGVKSVGGPLSVLRNPQMGPLSVTLPGVSVDGIAGDCHVLENDAMPSADFGDALFGVDGELRVMENLALTQLSMTVESIGSDAVVELNPALLSITLADLASVGGSASVSQNARLSALAALQLAQVGQNLTVSVNGGYTIARGSCAVGNAASVGGGVLFAQNFAFGVLKLGVSSTGGSLSCVDNGALSQGAFLSGVANISGSLRCANNPTLSLLDVALPGQQVAGIGGDCVVELNANARSAAFAGATFDIGGVLRITANAALELLHMTSSSVSSDAIVASNPSLVNVTLAALASVGGGVAVQDNIALTTLMAQNVASVAGAAAIAANGGASIASGSCLFGVPSGAAFGGGVRVASCGGFDELALGIGSADSVVIEANQALVGGAFISGLGTCRGDLTVVDNAQLSSLTVDFAGFESGQQQPSSIAQDIKLAQNDQLVEARIGGAKYSVGGAVSVTLNPSLETLFLSAAGVDADVLISSNSALLAAAMPNLSSVGAGILAADNTQLTTLSAPTLQSVHNISCSENGAGVADPSIGEGLVVGDAMLVQSTVHLSRNDGFSVLRLGLNATGGNVSVVQNGALGDGAFIKGLTSLNGTLLVSGQREMGALTVMLPGAEVAGIAAHLIVEENAAISSVDFGDARFEVGGGLTVTDNAACQRLRVTCASVKGDVVVARNQVLTNVTLPHLERAQAAVYVQDNTVLNTLSVPALAAVGASVLVADNGWGDLTVSPAPVDSAGGCVIGNGANVGTWLRVINNHAFYGLQLGVNSTGDELRIESNGAFMDGGLIAGLTLANGSFSVLSNSLLSALRVQLPGQSVAGIAGDCVVASNDNLGSAFFGSALFDIAGTLNVSLNRALEQLTLTAETVGLPSSDDALVHLNPSLANATLRELAQVGGSLNVSNCSSLRHLDLRGLAKVGANASVAGCGTSVPNAMESECLVGEAGGGMVTGAGAEVLETHGFDVLRLGLKSTGANATVARNGGLSGGIHVTALSSVNGTLSCSNNTNATALDVQLAEANATIAQNVSIRGNAALVSVVIDGASLDVGRAVEALDNPSLASLAMSTLRSCRDGGVRCARNALRELLLEGLTSVPGERGGVEVVDNSASSDAATVTNMSGVAAIGRAMDCGSDGVLFRGNSLFTSLLLSVRVANASVVIDTNSDFRRGVSVADVELLEGDLQVTGCTAAAPDPTAALNISGAPGGAVIGGALVVSDNSMLRAVSCIGVASVGGQLLLEKNGQLLNATVVGLQSVTQGRVAALSNARLDTLDLRDLIDVGEECNVTGNGASGAERPPGVVNLGALQSTGGGFDLVRNARFAQLLSSGFLTCGGAFRVLANVALVDPIAIAAFEESGPIAITSNADLTAVDIVGGADAATALVLPPDESVTVTDNPSLVFARFTNLATVSGEYYVANNAELEEAIFTEANLPPTAAPVAAPSDGAQPTAAPGDGLDCSLCEADCECGREACPRCVTGCSCGQDQTIAEEGWFEGCALCEGECSCGGSCALCEQGCECGGPCPLCTGDACGACAASPPTPLPTAAEIVTVPAPLPAPGSDSSDNGSPVPVPAPDTLLTPESSPTSAPTSAFASLAPLPMPAPAAPGPLPSEGSPTSAPTSGGEAPEADIPMILPEPAPAPS